MAKKRIRRLFSIREELLKKSREAALAAVQIFNSPSISFKAETHVVLMIIAWTYLLHAYYRAGEEYGIAKHLSVSLQFSSLSREQVETLEEHPGLPGHLKSYISGFDRALSEAEFASPKFAYRVVFVPKTVNHPNQADQAITFVKADSEIAKTVNASYTVIRETERPKWLPSAVVAKMKAEGFQKFGMTQHTDLWKALDAKSPGKGLGVQIAKVWYWYDSWLEVVRAYVRERPTEYR